MTAQNNWRRRMTSVFATATAGLLAVGGALLAPTVAFAEPAAAEKGTVAEATLDWGVKASFRKYIYDFKAFEGRTSLLGTARQADSKGTYQWGGGSGAGTSDGAGLDVSFGAGNGVHFQSHPMTVDGKVVYALDMTFTNPHVVVTSPTTGELRMDVEGYKFKNMTEVGDPYSMDDALLATLQLSAPTRVDGALTWSGAAATLTEEGAIAFGGFYEAGTQLDPLTFSAQITPSPVATRTTLSAATGTVYAGGKATVSASVEPAVEGSFTFFNGETQAGGSITAEAGTASTELSGLAVGRNKITATFTPADEKAAKASTSEVVVIDAVAPEITATLKDGTPYKNQPVKAGDKFIVKGVGFDPKANIGGRGVPIPKTLPQGVYVVFGDFTHDWKPSAASAGAVRAVGSQGWVLTEDTVNQIPANHRDAVRDQWVELNADGSFTWEVTLASPTVAVKNGHFGIFTYGAGGMNNAAQEREIPVNYTTTKTSAVATTMPATAELGDTVSIKAAVTPVGAAGKVQFTYGATEKTATIPLGDKVTVANGIAILATNALPRGANYVKAKFISDDPSEFSSSESPVQKIDISTKLSAEINPGGSKTVNFGDTVKLVAGPFDPSVTHVRIVVHSDPINLGVFAVTDRWVRAQLDWSKLPAGFSGDHTVAFTPVNADGSAIADAESVSTAFDVSKADGSGNSGGPGGTKETQSNAGATGLANTGADGITGIVLGGSLALAVGAGLLLIRRRQHS